MSIPKAMKELVFNYLKTYLM